MTSGFLSAIQILTRPAQDPSPRDVPSSQQGALLAALDVNRAALLERLHDDGSLEEVRRRREELKAAADWLSGDGVEDGAWRFVQELLLLLLALTRHLSEQQQCSHQAPPPSTTHLTPEMAPPLPPDVLSVAQQKTIGAALQFAVCLGLCPYMAPGVGVALSRRSAWGGTLEELAGEGAGPEAGRRLLVTTRALLQLAEVPSLATLLFTRHLGDLMAALCQLGHQPQRHGQTVFSEEERRCCREQLRSMLGKVYQPIVIKELLLLQGGGRQNSAPAWLRRLCGRLLSERLIQPSGVQAVVRAVLEGGGEVGGSDWRRCDSVARVLVACPQQTASADEYYRLVCPQILDLLHFKDKLTALQFQRVATRAVLSVVQERPSYAQQYLLRPLVAALRRCTATADVPGGGGAEVGEAELTQCVDDIYKVCVVGNSPSPSLLEALREVVPVIFSLFCFTLKNVSHLRAPCQEILLWYLVQAEPSGALSVLDQLSGLQPTGSQLSQDFLFRPGSSGGARLSHRERCRDEEEQLFEKLSEEAWRLECLTQLLSELTDSHLPGDFFLHLLQELTSWAAEEEEEETGGGEPLPVAAMTLLEAEQRLHGAAARRGRSLALLQALAAMVEKLQHEQLLRNTAQVVDFMVSLLQRAVVGLDGGRGPQVGNPVESQTLSMGMGLVATLLSGPPQLSSQDFSAMAPLLPALQTLAQRHPDAFIQELASDLRAVIATRGAYRPQDPRPQDPRPQDPRPQDLRPQDLRPQDPRPKDLRPQDPRPQDPRPQDLRPQDPRPQDPRPQDLRLQDLRPQDLRPAARRPSSSQNSGARDSQSAARPPSKPLSDWLLEACDPDVPTRAFALRTMTHLVQSRDPEAVPAQEKVLTIFLENLEHEDSFIYLSSIQGLAALADSYPDRILERLLKDFELGPSLPSSDQQRSLETRLKVGEVLMRASRAMGDLTPHLGRPLLAVFLRGAKDPDRSVRASSLSNLGELCQRMDYSLGALAQELSSCLTALMRTEKEAEVRRAAVHVIVLLLRGLGDKTTQVLGDVLLDLYRALRLVARSDQDQVVVLQAQLALEELDQVMKTFIFPRQKLEKKIVVLP